MSKNASRNSSRVAADSTVLFAAIGQKGDLEPLLLGWCSRGEIELSVSEQAVEEIERVLDIGTDQLRDVLFHNSVRVVSDNAFRKDPQYNEYAQEAKQVGVASRPAFVFAKIFLRDDKKAVFITEDTALLGVRDKLYGRAVNVNDFIRDST